MKFLSRSAVLAIALLLVSQLFFNKAAIAGGGPENVMLVVNEESWASLAVANHYIQLRKIPACNVVYLSGVQLSWDNVKIEVFREKILIPVLEAIQRRGLEPQIDYIVYSADFPFSINVRGDLAGDPGARSLPKYVTTGASINGLTYLYESVLEGDWRTYLSLHANLYSRAQGKGFRSGYVWNPTGDPVTQVGTTDVFHKSPSGPRYMLSTMLAVTSGRGNSMSEVVNYLDRAAAADGTKPSGTIYMMRNSNVRSTTREWAFNQTVTALTQLGVKSRVEKGIVPRNRDDVMGAVVGAATFDLQRGGSTILPGAICEHLTSIGGDMRLGRGQTPLSDFLRHGAAGSSGTVTEPYAIQAKFPTSLIHVSYASGCSLAESFYQSVSGPYQLLIVGDPLCQPWAERPVVTATGIRSNQTVSGDVMLTASAVAPGGVERVELFLDGKRIEIFPANVSYSLDTRQLWDGPHELRIVAISRAANKTQGGWVIPFEVDNDANGESSAGVKKVADPSTENESPPTEGEAPSTEVAETPPEVVEHTDASPSGPDPEGVASAGASPEDPSAAGGAAEAGETSTESDTTSATDISSDDEGSTIAKHGDATSSDDSKKDSPTYGDDIIVEVSFPRSEWVGVFHGDRLLGRIPDGVGRATVTTRRLGVGKFKLRAVAFEGDKEVEERRFDVSVKTLTVDPMRKPPKPRALRRGLLREIDDEKKVIPKLDAPLFASDDLPPSPLEGEKSFEIRTFFQTDAAGIYQFQLRPSDRVSSLRLNGVELHKKREGEFAASPVRLVPGWYELQINGKIVDNSLPDIQFGKANVLPLAADRFYCFEK